MISIILLWRLLKLHIANIIGYTDVEGPDTRTAIWFQGCNIYCKECCNPEYLEIGKGKEYSCEELISFISEFKTTGITILGGEPLLQADELYNFLLEYKKLYQNKSIFLFTGFEWKTLLKNNLYEKTIMLSDLVVSGPFQKKSTPDNRRWIGSTNQEIHFITEKFKYLKKSWPEHKNEIEFHITNDEIIINGTPMNFNLIE